MARVKKKANCDKYLAKRREAVKQCMQRARDKLKQDPEKLEEARKKDRERKKAQRKSINEMPPRQQRVVRKQWKRSSKAYRERAKAKKQINDNFQENDTPPSSPIYATPSSTTSSQPSTSRVESGKRKQRKNRKLLKNENEDLRKEITKLKQKVEKYRKRCQRSKSPIEATPRKKVKLMLRGQRCSNAVKKQLVFGEVLRKQISTNFNEEKSIKLKRYVAKFMSGKIVKKYKVMSKVRDIISRRTTINLKANTKNFEKLTGARKDVTAFLSQDEHSKQCAGKKETITRNKIKMQKRLLTDSLKSLHKKFIATCENHKTMSYSRFCKLRPFWITIPDCKNRDTCLCKLHTNMDLIVSKLNKTGLICEKNSKEVLASLTCEGKIEELCLQRKCANCKEKNIAIGINDENKNDTINYFYWNTINVEIEIKGNKKKKKKTVKEEMFSTKGRLVNLFKTLLKKFINHVFNIKHQYSAIRNVKENLEVNEVLLHMDYSENYNCKLKDEIQSLHFGGSRNQATLHTSILYYRDKHTEEELKSVCFCTISEERRHDAVAVCGHLKPILKEIYKFIPDLSKIHFVSDGPSSQYRNRKMFLLIGEYLTSLMSVKSINWHYLEAGHGKGAADGVGGCLKRTADNLVAKGVDIPTVSILVEQMNLHCPGIKVIHVAPQEVLECDSLQLNIPKFKGTIKTHELCWTETTKNRVQVRSLTCTPCAANECVHFHLGFIQLQDSKKQNKSPTERTTSASCSTITVDTTTKSKQRFRYHDVYSDDDDEDSAVEETDYELNSFVVVKYETEKKKIVHYIGVIQSSDGTRGFEVKFMRKSGLNLFVFPSKDDVEVVDRKDIVAKLQPPLSVNNRGQYKFCEGLIYHNLC